MDFGSGFEAMSEEQVQTVCRELGMMQTTVTKAFV